MAKFRNILIVVLAAVCLGQAALLLLQNRRDGWQQQAADLPVSRGLELAERMGCFGCHGPGGTRPIRNPGARYGETPNWGDGTWMLWSRSEDDVRSWIRDGHPPSRPADRGGLIPMPAYGQRLSEAELEELVGYVLAVSRFGEIEDKQAREGREIAERFGCFGCHGPEGRGVVANPGSFKGYIPAWDGDDYLELVQDDEELRQWVRDGISERMRSNPVARRILETQQIQMPAYGEHLDASQIEALAAYVRWLRDHPRPTPASAE